MRGKSVLPPTPLATSLQIETVPFRSPAWSALWRELLAAIDATFAGEDASNQDGVG